MGRFTPVVVLYVLQAHLQYVLIALDRLSLGNELLVLGVLKVLLKAGQKPLERLLLRDQIVAPVAQFFLEPLIEPAQIRRTVPVQCHHLGPGWWTLAGVAEPEQIRRQEVGLLLLDLFLPCLDRFVLSQPLLTGLLVAQRIEQTHGIDFDHTTAEGVRGKLFGLELLLEEEEEIELRRLRVPGCEWRLFRADYSKTDNLSASATC
uniref:Uncharacterized protein n=1 Tax=Anopheles melas TaxID=34690 RepID=A0A182U394_9DIPT